MMSKVQPGRDEAIGFPNFWPARNCEISPFCDMSIEPVADSPQFVCDFVHFGGSLTAGRGFAPFVGSSLSDELKVQRRCFCWADNYYCGWEDVHCERDDFLFLGPGVCEEGVVSRGKWEFLPSSLEGSGECVNIVFLGGERE
jgi:hypothetical protein